MRSRVALIAFLVFAPVTVPVYLVFLAGANLLGGAFYIVIEASIARLARRPITLSRPVMALLAVPVLAAAPIAVAVHLAIWLVGRFLHLLTWLGHWQTGAKTRLWSSAAGLTWTLATLWATVTCLNAALGLACVGRPVHGSDAFVEHFTRYRSLGEMPSDMQQRRQRLIHELNTLQDKVEPNWQGLLNILQDDETPFGFLVQKRPLVARKLADLPWFFYPAELSTDGLDHSQMLLGPLLLVWMLVIRWPGMPALCRSTVPRVIVFLVRLALAAGAVYYLVTWTPVSSSPDFYFASPSAMRVLRWASPAAWLGLDHLRFVRVEWYLFNTGLWLAVIGLVVFVWWLAWRISPFLGWPRYYVAFMASRLLQRKRIAFFSVGAVTLCVAMMIIVISVMGGFVDSIRARAHGLLGDLVVDGGLAGFPYYEEFIHRIASLRDDQTGRPVVVQATPLIHSYGILQFRRTKKTKPVRIWGVRLDEYVRVNEFSKDLFYENRFGGTSLKPVQIPVYGFDERGLAVLPGDLDVNYGRYLASLPPDQRATEEKQFRRLPGEAYPGPGVFEMASDIEPKPGFEGQAFPGVIIGRDLIFRRLPSGDYRRGEEYPRGEHCYLTVLPLTRSGDVSPEPPPKPSFRYIDDSRTGIYEIDSMNVYVDFDELQRLLTMEAQSRADGAGLASPRCSQVQIKVDAALGRDRAMLQQTKERIWQVWEKLRDQVPSDPTEDMLMAQVDIQTWEEMQHTYIAAIEKEKFLVLIMFGVISIVAVFLILCIFYMIVQEKTRDIGIIKSVGGSAEGVVAVFLAYGGAIGLVGSVLGSLLGIVFVEHINEVQDFLARLNPAWRVWSPETYSFDKIPDVWKWAEVIWISMLAVVASVAGAAFPALRAGRTWPVDSLRYE